MKRFIVRTFLLAMVLTILLVGCTSTEEEGPIVLQVTGAVSGEKGFTAQDLKDLGTQDVDFTEKSGEVSTYSGTPVTAILEDTGLNADASGVVLVGDDGYEAEATLEEVQACADCIITILDDGSLQAVMPGFSGKLQVKGLVEIRVK
jgi:hypothetical protein